MQQFSIDSLSGYSHTSSDSINSFIESFEMMVGIGIMPTPTQIIIPVRLLILGILMCSSARADDVALSSQQCVDPGNSTDTIYRFTERELNGSRIIRLSRYTGKVGFLSLNIIV